MKFIIERTSLFGGEDEDDDVMPCEEAVREGDMWIIELSDLDSLLSFVDRVGRIVVFPPPFDQLPGGTTMPCIEIYDDYRE